MSESESAFTRDKAKFLGLLRQVVARIGEADDDSVGQIVPLIAAIDETDPAIKLGFSVAPFQFVEVRDRPPHRYVHEIIWNDPHGAGGGEVWLSAPQEVIGKEVDYVRTRSKADDRERLLRVADRWLLAVRELSEPDTYPALQCH